MKIPILFCIFPPKIIIPRRDIECTSSRVQQPWGDHIKSRGGQGIPLRGIATNHHCNVCSQAETTNVVEISTKKILSRQTFVIPHCDIAYTTPRVQQPRGGTLKPR